MPSASTPSRRDVHNGVVRHHPRPASLIADTVTTHVLIGALYPLQFDLLSGFNPIALLAQGPLLAVAKTYAPAP